MDRESPSGGRLRLTPIVLLQAANLLSGVANGVTVLAIPWLVLERTGSVAAAGTVAAISFLPPVLASPLAGWAVDHIGRRVVSIASDVLSAVSVAAIPLVALLTDLTLPWILGLAILGATFDPSGYTARRALLPDVAEASGMPVTRLNGIHEGVFSVGWVVGPLAGSLLIAGLGINAAFWAPFGCFVIAAVLIGVLRVGDSGQDAKAAREASGQEHPSAWQNAVLGLRILWTDPVLRALTLAVTILAAIYLPTESVLLPAHFVDLEQPGALGIILASLAAGTILGAFGFGWLATRFSQRGLMRTALLGTAVAYIPMALLPPLPVLAVAGFTLGLAWGPMQPLMTTLIQNRVDPDAQGRVFGIQLSLFSALPPMSMLATGAAAERFGIPAVLLLLAGLLVVMAVATVSLRALRHVDPPSSSAPSTGPATEL